MSLAPLAFALKFNEVAVSHSTGCVGSVVGMARSNCVRPSCCSAKRSLESANQAANWCQPARSVESQLMPCIKVNARPQGRPHAKQLDLPLATTNSQAKFRNRWHV